MRKLKLLFAATIMTAAGGIGVANSHQPPGVEYEIRYYDRDPFLNGAVLLGHYRDYCDGSSNGWGSITPYSEANYYGC
jgi:hypothetical protein